MEFVVREPSRHSQALDKANNYSMRVNWFYRPKDISRKSGDSRLLYATMHSDVCPLHSCRGKCIVRVRDAIEDFDKYRTTPDCFWFDKLYDRYIIRFYDVIPTEKIINIPPKLHQILCTKFKYALVEVGKGKELLATAKSCEKCSQWCSPDDSVQCAHCKRHYHMLCIDPPLYRKPTRGFGWSCAVCSGALERKLEENKGLFRSDTLLVGDVPNNNGEKQISEESITDGSDETASNGASISSTPLPQSSKTRPSSSSPIPMSRYEELEQALAHSLQTQKPISEEQRHQISMWPFRYLGVHSKLEDILDGDDRIYPRAQSRLGSKHQAVVPEWPGRPIIYYEVDKPERKNTKKGSKNKTSNNTKIDLKNAVEGVESSSSSIVTYTTTPNERPPWMHKKPSGYVERGGDSTATLMWREPETNPQLVDDYLHSTESYAKKLGISPNTPNFFDAVLKAFLDTNYIGKDALAIVSGFTKKSLKEPIFTSEEKKRFEQAIRKFGSELHDVYREVKTKKAADIVRFYYLWKKTPAGREVRGKNDSRRSKKGHTELNSTTDDGLADEVADNADDSSYDNEKSQLHQRTYQCKFCQTTTSIQWRRAPGFPVADKSNPIVALCLRCARLWRKYAVIWEDPEEVMRKYNSRGTVAKKRMEEELLEDSRAILAERDRERERESRKKLKPDKDVATYKPNNETIATVPSSSVTGDMGGSQSSITKKGSSKKKQPVSVSENIEIAIPPCSICSESYGQLLVCQGCGIQVHGFCYGVNQPSSSEWFCDTCSNDKHPLINTIYSCCICPVRENRELADSGKSIISDALKRTLDNNWIHVRCAIWTPEIRFGNSLYLQPAEEINNIPSDRFHEACVICGTTNGACISCGVCGCFFHIGCAGKSNYVFGFDVQPVKSSRRDHVKVVKLGKETGVLSAVVVCPSHHKQIKQLHNMTEVAEGSNKTALQLYCETYKSSEHMETGSMRRALLYPISREPESKKSKTELHQASEDLALVLSRNNTLIEHSISNSSLECSSCHIKNVPFWYEELQTTMEKNIDYDIVKTVGVTAKKDGTLKNIVVKCMNCYWKDVDSEAYEEVFEWEPLQIIRQDRLEKLHNKTAQTLLSIANNGSQLQFVKDARQRAPFIQLDNDKDKFITEKGSFDETKTKMNSQEQLFPTPKVVETGDMMEDIQTDSNSEATSLAKEKRFDKRDSWVVPENNITSSPVEKEQDKTKKDIILHDMLIKNECY